MARGLFVGLVHLCIAVKPADKPAAKPRARTRFSALANDDAFLVTAELDERRVMWPFSIEDWTSEEPATKKRVPQAPHQPTTQV